VKTGSPSRDQMEYKTLRSSSKANKESSMYPGSSINQPAGGSRLAGNSAVPHMGKTYVKKALRWHAYLVSLILLSVNTNMFARLNKLPQCPCKH
jgi:hypothetical protein